MTQCSVDVSLGFDAERQKWCVASTYEGRTHASWYDCRGKAVQDIIRLLLLTERRMVEPELPNDRRPTVIMEAVRKA